MIDAAIVAVFLLACLALGMRARGEESAEGWILAGRALTFPVFVMSLVPTFYGGVLGIGEFTWTSGISNWVVMALPYYVFAGLYAFFLAGKVRSAPGLTIPDHLADAYGKRWPCSAPCWFSFSPPPPTNCSWPALSSAI
ncbi:MAG: hypothetical protein M0D55_17110 [Elusimicrobiota bacterium]|nr:MAG: hypothetical protein M0D55_17110 [Elusimicrobiota bacterium]